MTFENSCLLSSAFSPWSSIKAERSKILRRGKTTHPSSVWSVLPDTSLKAFFIASSVYTSPFPPFHFCHISGQADMKVQAFLWEQWEIQTMQSPFHAQTLTQGHLLTTVKTQASHLSLLSQSILDLQERPAQRFPLCKSQNVICPIGVCIASSILTFNHNFGWGPSTSADIIQLF